MWVFRDTQGERTVSQVVLTDLSLHGEQAIICIGFRDGMMPDRFWARKSQLQEM